jgi:hypothetical protein
MSHLPAVDNVDNHSIGIGAVHLRPAGFAFDVATKASSPQDATRSRRLVAVVRPTAGVALSALAVSHENVLEAWEQVYHSDPPAEVVDSYVD